MNESETDSQYIKAEKETAGSLPDAPVGTASIPDEAHSKPTVRTAALVLRWAAGTVGELSSMKGRRIAVSIVTVLAITLAGWAYSSNGGRNNSIIAVLPLVNVNAEQNLEYLSDGMTESLIRSLSRLPNLTVRRVRPCFVTKARTCPRNRSARI